MSRAVFLLFLASLIAVFAGLVWADAYRQRATGSQVTGAVYARYGAGPWQRLLAGGRVALGYVLAAHLPAEEPIMAWWRWAKQSPTRAAPEGLGVRIRAHDHALLIGRCEYHVHGDRGWVEVRDYTDPRSMRSQFYQPDRPGQPYLAPSVEERGPKWQ